MESLKCYCGSLRRHTLIILSFDRKYRHILSYILCFKSYIHVIMSLLFPSPYRKRPTVSQKTSKYIHSLEESMNCLRFLSLMITHTLFKLSSVLFTKSTCVQPWLCDSVEWRVLLCTRSLLVQFVVRAHI